MLYKELYKESNELAKERFVLVRERVAEIEEKPETEEKYKEITAAGRVLCNYCQNTECENCQVTRLLDDAALDAVEDGVIDDLER